MKGIKFTWELFPVEKESSALPMLHFQHKTLSFATISAVVSDMRREKQVTKKSSHLIEIIKNPLFKLNVKNINKCIPIMYNLSLLDFPVPFSPFAIRLLDLGFGDFCNLSLKPIVFRSKACDTKVKSKTKYKMTSK